MPRVTPPAPPPPQDPWEEIFADDPVLGFRVPPAWDRRKRSLEAFYDEGGFVFTTLRDGRTVFQHTDAGLDPDDLGYSLEAAEGGGPSPGMLDLALNALNEYVPPAPTARRSSSAGATSRAGRPGSCTRPSPGRSSSRSSPTAGRSPTARSWTG